VHTRFPAIPSAAQGASPRPRATEYRTRQPRIPSGTARVLVVENARETCGFRVDACVRVGVQEAPGPPSRHDFLCSHKPPLLIESLLRGPGCGPSRFSTFPQQSSSQQALGLLRNQNSFAVMMCWFLPVENNKMFRKTMPAKLGDAGINHRISTVQMPQSAFLGFILCRKASTVRQR
jgi:hypothetical protein